MAQLGFVYERYASDALKKYDIVPATFTPAGAGADQPDLIIKKPGPRALGQSGCELKISPAASGGSLVLKYINGKWQFDEIPVKDVEKRFIKAVAVRAKALDKINKAWNGIESYKFATSALLTNEKKILTKREQYAKELKRFPDVKGEISATEIEGYYNTKDTYYINVGTHGLYLLGQKNPLNLKGLRTFGKLATAGYRARVQNKGGGNYQFTFELTFGIIKTNRSEYNIAPVTSAKNVTINLEVMEKSIAHLFKVEI